MTLLEQEWNTDKHGLNLKDAETQVQERFA